MIADWISRYRGADWGDVPDRIVAEVFAWVSVFHGEDRGEPNVELRKHCIDELVKRFRAGLYKGDGAYLRDLADGVEMWHKWPVKRLEWHLINLLFEPHPKKIGTLRQKHVLTVAVIHAQLKSRGVHVSERHLRRKIAQWKIKVLPDAIGRKSAERKVIRTRFK